MHNDNLVACVKVNGQILRENGSLVSLPFGCEYSILVKNLNSVRAQVSVSVDGKDAVGRVVIAPNSSVELERFVQNGNLEAGNRFKFIERTADIEKHRGIGSDDGLIRVEGWRESVPVRFYGYQHPSQFTYPPYPPRPPMRPRMHMMARSAPRPTHPTSRGSTPNPPRPDLRASTGTRKSAPCGDIGITVPGSESRQRFVSVSGFPLESGSAVIVLHLRGAIGDSPIAQPVTVAMKPICETCGTKNKPGGQYCSKCGTALVAYA